MDPESRPAAFDRLHPALQHHIVNSLQWRALRPLQEKAIGPLLDGAHALLVAPTAGGKTEAAVFPLLSRVLEEGWAPLSVLYVCPLRALLNNLELRLSLLFGLVGRRVALWHGDVSPATRREIQRDPPDLLLTTPESIEVMLLSRSVDRERLFSGLRAVVVDELHAFAGDDRGWHLLSVLERVSRFAGHPLQRIGLSATIGNPDQLSAWLAGSSPGPRCVISPPAPPAPEAQVELDYVASLDNAALLLASLHRGEKRLVFCDSRSQVEELAFRLRERGVTTFVSHGSLGVDERRAAERAFAEGRDCTIVSTSTLELGIDVGDLDRVVQVDAPSTVASFLQRLGRSGRRPGTSRNLLFLALDPEGLLRAGGLVDLWRRGFVEPLAPPELPYPILAQQLLALAIQSTGFPRREWATWVGGMPGFAGLPRERIEQLFESLVAEGWLFEEHGLVAFGPESDRRFRGKGFLDLLSVFSSSPLVRVLHGRQELGFVDEATFQLKAPEGGQVLLLGGRPWRVLHVDWEGREAHVEPVGVAGRSIWLGSGPPLGFQLCQAMKRVLLEGSIDGLLTRRARKALEDLRGEHPWLEADRTTLVRETPGRARWWTFGGLCANATLADALERAGQHTTGRDNLSIRLDVTAGMPDLRALLPAPSAAMTLRPDGLAEGAIDSLKFAFCTPRELCLESLRERLADQDGVREVLMQAVSRA